MADVREKVEAELESVAQAVSQLPSAAACEHLSVLELAGAGALLHAFYNGIENVLKQVLLAVGQLLPTGVSWHRDLVNAATARGIISEGLASELRNYLAFRHFFSHGYAVNLSRDRLAPLIAEAQEVLTCFQGEIASFLGGLTPGGSQSRPP